jgi:D-aminoacyl-tRNA deacylase
MTTDEPYKIALINSFQDPAGRLIKERILVIAGDTGLRSFRRGRVFFSVHEVRERLIHLEHPDRGLDADLIIFLSRHQSAHPSPVLTVHGTGNFRTADFGGAPRTCVPLDPAWMHAVLQELNRRAPPGYRVSYEATHHGPTSLTLPSLFVEIGSTPDEWSDPAAADAVAQSVLCAQPHQVIRLLGFGGTHYARRQTAIALSSRGAFGHIVPTRDIQDLDRDLIGALASASHADAIYIDRKALSSRDLAGLGSLLTPLGLPILSEGDLTAIGDLPWATYVTLTRMADAYRPGAHITPHKFSGSFEPVLIEIPPDLLTEALKAGASNLISGLTTFPVVHLTSGDHQVLPGFFCERGREREDLHALINLCLMIICGKRDTARSGDCLIIRRTRMDPAKARSLGIPPGPLLATLIEGRPVTVGGRTVTPEMVLIPSETRVNIPGLRTYL